MKDTSCIKQNKILILNIQAYNVSVGVIRYFVQTPVLLLVLSC